MAFPYEKLLNYTLRIAKLSKLIFFFISLVVFWGQSQYARGLFSVVLYAEHLYDRICFRGHDLIGHESNQKAEFTCNTVKIEMKGIFLSFVDIIYLNQELELLCNTGFFQRFWPKIKIYLLSMDFCCFLIQP